MAGYRVNFTFTEIVPRRTKEHKKEEVQDTEQSAVGVLSQEVRRPEREVSPLLSSSGEVKNLSTSIPPTFLRGADMQNMTLTCNSNSSQ